MGTQPETEGPPKPTRTSIRERKAPERLDSHSRNTADFVRIAKVRKAQFKARPTAPACVPKPTARTPKPAPLPRVPAASKSKLAGPAAPAASDAPASREKRPKRFRPHPPQSVVERLHHATSQRMFVLSRSTTASSGSFTMAGSTGNVYHITISHVPHCDCPDGSKGNTCKHILYIMHRVLHAREDLAYQAGLLLGELEEIFTAAPSSAQSARKPLDSDDCPICYCAVEKEEETAWCRAQCGTNLHRACFAQWKATRGGEGVTCVMCRQPWIEADAGEVGKVLGGGGADVGEDGYLNVAGKLGMSTVRDISTYNEWFTGGYGRYGRR